MVKYEKITLSYANRQIFENFSLEIASGENLCFAGQSGRGKTTLIKMIPGLVSPDSGEIFVDNLKLIPQNLNKIRKFIAWIPQNINLPVTSASELIQLLNISDKKNQIAENLDSLGLNESYFEKQFSDISGGEKQRIVIAVTLAKNKPILLIDEPTSALDKKSIELLAQLILNQGKNITVISASHNQQWLKFVERVIEI